MLLNKIIADYSENHTKPIITLCEENAELFAVKTVVTYNYY
jgi:hypothetical protein